ncbi:amidohydrolase [Devosia sp. BK]|uniref:amidohydrolase family protein n=1 Tax=Devosia sp. BK TaxID=2871706 RepID=UPI00293B5BF8|nr:amidohydrolase [Devosia sp. BK]MDV3253728.1 amidohydrolase [Devosia sp. BK]
MRILLSNLFLCDGTPNGFIADAAILIEGKTIVWTGPASEAPVAAAVRDLAGRVVIPGLINTHAHGGMSVQRGCCDNGDLFEWAQTIAPFTSVLSLEDNRFGCELAVMEMVRNGITTACDCTRFGAGIFSDVASAIGMRSLSGALANSPQYRKTGRANWPLAREETEGAMARHAGNGLVRHYLGAHSPYSCTAELLIEVKQAADELGLPFVIHLAESAKETEIVRERHGTTPMRWLHGLGLLDERSILAHCIWLDDEEIELLAETGASVAHNPVSNAKLASGIAPIPAMRQAGIVVGLGTDSTVSNNSLDIFQEMKASILLQRASSLDAHITDAADAFAMATREGARVLGWQDAIGTLVPGKQADLVVLDLDHPLGNTAQRVLSDIVYKAGPQHVREVMVAGSTIYADGRFSNIDAGAIFARIKQHYAHIPSA